MSLALHYWIEVHITAQGPVSEMTYTVSNGTLNSTIPYHTISYLGISYASHPKRVVFQCSPILGVLPYLCLHPLMQNNQIWHGNTYREASVSEVSHGIAFAQVHCAVCQQQLNFLLTTTLQHISTTNVHSVIENITFCNTAKWKQSTILILLLLYGTQNSRSIYQVNSLQDSETTYN